METSSRKSTPALGFLTVVEHAQYGLFGGYLVLNLAGRPLEFHCTAPIKPNRAQEILYGPTLAEFIYGEQIGQTLINKSSIPPVLVLTDRTPALSARPHVSAPLALVLPYEPQTMPVADGRPTEAVASAEKTFRLDAAHDGGPRLAFFQHGRNRLALPERAEDDRRLVVERLATLDESFDLAEPFERIREAIEEARQAAR